MIDNEFHIGEGDFLKMGFKEAPHPTLNDTIYQRDGISLRYVIFENWHVFNGDKDMGTFFTLYQLNEHLNKAGFNFEEVANYVPTKHSGMMAALIAMNKGDSISFGFR